MLNSREWAITTWLIIVLAVVFVHGSSRTAIIGLIKAFVAAKIVVPIVLLFGYIALEIALGNVLHIWSSALLKDTLVWATISGLAMFFGYDQVTQKSKFFRRRIFAAFGLSVFLDVFVNLYTFSFPVELVLQPLLVVLVIVSAFSNNRLGYRQTKRLTDFLLAVIGFTVFFLTVRHVAMNWATLNKGFLAAQLILPAWLTIGLLPFVYVIALYANYEEAFLRLSFTRKSLRHQARAKIALVICLNVQARKVGKLDLLWLRKIADTSSLLEACRVVNRYRHALATSKEA